MTCMVNSCQGKVAIHQHTGIECDKSYLSDGVGTIFDVAS